MEGGHGGKLGGADQGPEQVTRAEECGCYPGDARIPRRESKQRQAQERATFWDGYRRGHGEQGERG